MLLRAGLFLLWAAAAAVAPKADDALVGAQEELAHHAEPVLGVEWVNAPLQDVDDARHQDGIISLLVSHRAHQLQQLKADAGAVSDPDSLRYGEHLTHAEVQARTAPPPTSMAVVHEWLSKSPCSVSPRRGGGVFTVRCTLAATGTWLSTTIRLLRNTKTGQLANRATAYALPEAVDAAAVVYGLHGLPLPPRARALAGDAVAPTTVAITPAVIQQAYKISGVSVSRANSSRNRQAVAEFQGNPMSPADLASFFKRYVPGAKPGDDTIDRFVGDPGASSCASLEGTLDVQFIMGLAPGVKTEMWYYSSMDFCSDLKNWTTGILERTTDGPLVYSISYGYQDDLMKLGCSPDHAAEVEADFVKLAALGISVLVASGDHGSGYVERVPTCNASDPSSYHNNTALVGTVTKVSAAQGTWDCCIDATLNSSMSGWSFDGPAGPPPQPGSCSPHNGTNGFALEGTVIYGPAKFDIGTCCEQSAIGIHRVGWTWVNSTKMCTIYSEVTGKKQQAGVVSGTNPDAARGNCTWYSSITGHTPNPNVISATCVPIKLELWPSWPASSPWVTSVGATRFLSLTTATGAEMAADSFGSGGGFSSQYVQSPDATWQSASVGAYVSNPPKDAHYPPLKLFPPTGRATPDVSAVGENYQVVVGGAVKGVGGTSASTPALAAITSLLNEARLQGKGKPMGYLNPFLYKHAAAFSDVLFGTNALSNVGGTVPFGFNATEGWDPTTGLGTPRFDRLLAAAMTPRRLGESMGAAVQESLISANTSATSVAADTAGSCAASIPLQPLTNIEGANQKNAPLHTASADACRAKCCAQNVVGKPESCGGFVWVSTTDPGQPTAECTHHGRGIPGEGCCYLKLPGCPAPQNKTQNPKIVGNYTTLAAGIAPHVAPRPPPPPKPPPPPLPLPTDGPQIHYTPPPWIGSDHGGDIAGALLHPRTHSWHVMPLSDVSWAHCITDDLVNWRFAGGDTVSALRMESGAPCACPCSRALARDLTRLDLAPELASDLAIM